MLRLRDPREQGRRPPSAPRLVSIIFLKTLVLIKLFNSQSLRSSLFFLLSSIIEL